MTRSQLDHCRRAQLRKSVKHILRRLHLPQPPRRPTPSANSPWPSRDCPLGTRAIDVDARPAGGPASPEARELEVLYRRSRPATLFWQFQTCLRTRSRAAATAAAFYAGNRAGLPQQSGATALHRRWRPPSAYHRTRSSHRRRYGRSFSRAHDRKGRARKTLSSTLPLCNAKQDRFCCPSTPDTRGRRISKPTALFRRDKPSNLFSRLRPC